MRVLLTSVAIKSHYLHLVPIAWALRCAGHEVRVAAQPRLTDVITESGLTAVPVGSDESTEALFSLIGADLTDYHQDVDFTETRREVLTWDYLLGIQVMITGLLYGPLNDDATIDDTVAFARHWRPDLIICEPMSFSGAVAARVTGAAHARILWGPDVSLRARQNFLQRQAEQPPAHRDDPLAEWLTWTLDRYDREFDETVVTGRWSIDPTAPCTRLPLGLDTISTRYVPYNGRAVVPSWLSEPPRAPRVCLTLGVSAREDRQVDDMSIGTVLEALGDLDIEIVATLDRSQQQFLRSVPDNTRLVDFVPMHALLPTCEAVVHHGGAGTFLAANLYGVPQVTIPSLWEAPMKGLLLEEAGAGVNIRPETLTAQGLRDAVVRVLKDPSYRAAAASVRESMLAEPSVHEIVPVLERLTAGHARQAADRT